MKSNPHSDIFSGRDALAYQQRQLAGDAAPSTYHVQKRRRADKGLEIVFDPVGHKSYVTGFHKRKIQRRKEAHEKLAEKEKQQRLDDRKQRRADLAKKLQLDRYQDPEAVLAAAASRVASQVETVDVFDCEGVTTTVTAIAMNSDDERLGNDGHSDSNEDSSLANGSPTLTAQRRAESMEQQSDSHTDQSDSDNAFPTAEPSAVPPPAGMTSGAADDRTTDCDVGGSGGRGPIDRGVVLRASHTMKRKKRRLKAEQLAAKQAKHSRGVTQEHPRTNNSHKGLSFNSSKRKRRGSAAGHASKGKGSDRKRKK